MMNTIFWAMISRKWARVLMMLAVNVLAVGPMVCGLGGAAAWAATSGGVLLVDDQFNDGDVTDGADPLDVAWTSYKGPALSVQNDEGAGQLNGGNALLIDRSGENVTGTLADLPGGQIGLNDLGDFIKLEFEFRVVGVDLFTNVSYRGFRGGFFNKNGTPDDRNDDKGYFFQSGVGDSSFFRTALNLTVRQEFGGDPNGPANGGDHARGQSINMASALDDTTPYNLAFTLTRTDLGVRAEVDLNGNVASQEFYARSPANAIDLDRFDYFGIFASEKVWDIMVDNVRVTTNAPIPEPSSFVLIAMGLAAVGMRRRR